MIAQRGVEQRHFAHREARSAERDGKPALVVRGERHGEVGAGERQRRCEAARADGVERGYRRHVERMLQRLRHGDIAPEGTVEVVGPVRCKPARRIRDARVRRGDTVVERHAVDEGLQRRARRAWAIRQVDPAPGCMAVCGAGDGAHLARRNVDHHDGDLDAFARRAGGAQWRAASTSFCRARSSVVAMLSGSAGAADGFFRGVPGDGREVAARGRRIARRIPAPDRAANSFSSASRISTRSRATMAALRMQVRPPRFGRLRQGDQHGDLVGREIVRLAPEIRPRRRAHALEIAAIGRQREVEFEDLVLGVAPLELPGADRLDRPSSRCCAGAARAAARSAW